MPFASPRRRPVFSAPLRWLLTGGLTLAALLAGVDGGVASAATPGPRLHAARSGRGSRSGTRGRRTKKSNLDVPDSSSTFLLGKTAHVVPNQQGKIVVFHFRNDDDGALSMQVGQLLQARGLEVVPDVRPVDTAEQFRDVATHLDLVGYVEGDLRPTRDGKAKLTLRVRNGYTGRPVTQAVFTDSVDNLPRALSDKLWSRLAPAIAHACSDASRPRHRTRTMQINAGTPL
jgi:hypothetical protein